MPTTAFPTDSFLPTVSPSFSSHPTSSPEPTSSPTLACDEVLEWFSSRRVDPTVFFGTYFDCGCTGDLTSTFELVCTFKEDRCFEPYVPIANISIFNETIEDNEEKLYCYDRNYTIGFDTIQDESGDTDYMPLYEKVCYDYKSGPGAGNSICIQSPNPCSYQLKELHSYSTEGAVYVCNNYLLCSLILPNLGYTEEQTEKMCYRKFWNGQECFASDLPSGELGGECTGFVDDDRREIYVTFADCSDVDPCAVGTCQVQPFEYSTPDEASFYYSQCSSALKPTPMPTTAFPTDSFLPTVSPSFSSHPTSSPEPTSSPTLACDEVLEWFSSRRVDPTVFFGTYFDCGCTGDLTSTFELVCTFKEDRCFEPYVPIANISIFNETIEDNEEKLYCYDRNYTIGFDTIQDESGDTDYMPLYEKVCYDYKSGPGAGNSICIQSPNPCSYQLKELHSYSTEGAVYVCNNYLLCSLILPNLGYTEEQTEKMCYRKFWNGQECFASDLPSGELGGECTGFVDDDRREIYVTFADCSDVDPCAVGTCQVQPFEYSTPDANTFYYSQCSGTLKPTTTPTPMPSESVLPSTQPTAQPTEPFEVCFSGLTTVELEDGSFAQMKDLRIGDHVLVSRGKYEPIYGFGHFDTSMNKVDFFRIRTSTSSNLEISPNHLVFKEGNEVVSASNLVVGDRVLMGSGLAEEVVLIQTVLRAGAFAPFTPSGTIVTSGIQSSCFATVQNGSAKVLLGGGIELPLTYHQLGLVFESPHRLICRLFTCSDKYNEEGMSLWVETPLKGLEWILHQNVFVSGIVFLLAFALLVVTYILEGVLIKIPFSFLVSLTCIVAVFPGFRDFSCKKKKRGMKRIQERY